MTNYERIKAMSAEEMAEIIHACCKYCIYQGKECYNSEDMLCRDGHLKWLNLEVEE